jgi:hypothetical protein
MKKEIDVDNSNVLYDEPFTETNLKAKWKIYSGQWTLEEDGWLTGRNPGNFPGMIVSKDNFFGNVLVEFEARTVPPCTHDINFMWNGAWDESENKRGVAYVAGLQGWWEGKVGIEKSPDYKLNVGTPLLDFVPGRTYFIQGGSVDGHCFVCADGKLLLEVTDPDPIDNTRYGKVGFEAYCSLIQVRNVRIRQIAWRPLTSSYTPEF